MRLLFSCGFAVITTAASDASWFGPERRRRRLFPMLVALRDPEKSRGLMECRERCEAVAQYLLGRHSIPHYILDPHTFGKMLAESRLEAGYTKRGRNADFGHIRGFPRLQPSKRCSAVRARSDTEDGLAGLTAM
ncbi:hypothetical protein K491DRAFT_474263 [Lophiostoma macrostomum CBS 122681]|uniref:Uncharacterized protein n=1 Tax=Lophiostoma macrostomum CBS 122681 TaxID=1314788 RepID=A0A6A6T2S6_9PLEO|nr:hypothetical protein K491DRAFT_474263 [Lophiostoma macrostomum CBS 122681]